MKAGKIGSKSLKQGDTVQSKAGRQAPAGAILQTYKNRGIQSEVVQKVSALSLGNPYEFDVTKSDLGNGTPTSPETRDSVNSWSKFPTKIDWEYSIYDTKNGNAYVDGDNGTADNPPPQNPGQRYDAGHSLGRQNGGLGDDSSWVFPQNPQINRGNMFQGKKTYKEWREPENIFHSAVNDFGKGKWKITAL